MSSSENVITYPYREGCTIALGSGSSAENVPTFIIYPCREGYVTASESVSSSENVRTFGFELATLCQGLCVMLTHITVVMDVNFPFTFITLHLLWFSKPDTD